MTNAVEHFPKNAKLRNTMINQDGIVVSCENRTDMNRVRKVVTVRGGDGREYDWYAEYCTLIEAPTTRENEMQAAELGHEFARCRGCGRQLLPPDTGIADACTCNSPRGINHGLVPVNVCTCKECDPAETGSVRKPQPITEATPVKMNVGEAIDVATKLAATVRDGTKMTRHGIVQLLAYQQEDIADLRTQLATATERAERAEAKARELNVYAANYRGKCGACATANCDMLTDGYCAECRAVAAEQKLTRLTAELAAAREELAKIEVIASRMKRRNQGGCVADRDDVENIKAIVTAALQPTEARA